VCNVGTASDDDPRFQMDVSEEEHSRPQQDPPVPVGWLVSTSPIWACSRCRTWTTSKARLSA